MEGPHGRVEHPPIAEHLEETGKTPIVITFSVTADFPSPEFVPKGINIDLNDADEGEAWAVTFPELKRKRPDLRLVPAGDMMELALVGPLKHGIDIYEVVYRTLINMAIRDPNPEIRENAYKALGDTGKNIVDGAEVELEDGTSDECTAAVSANAHDGQGKVDDGTLEAIATRLSSNQAVMDALSKLEYDADPRG